MRVLIKRVGENATISAQSGRSCDVCDDDAGLAIVFEHDNMYDGDYSASVRPVAICTRCVKQAKVDFRREREERRERR